MFIVGWATLAGFAQTWSDEASGVLVPQAGTITANGVGSPSVSWDPVAQQYIMFFESRTGAATADCTAGLWSIGIASSDDGVTWDVWPDAVVSPTAGTPWRCVAAHPSAVYDGGIWHLWFKAEQGLNACTAGTPAWGCNNYSGIAHATVEVNLDDKTAEIAAVEAQIAALEASPPPLDTFSAALDAWEADLYASEAELGCADPLIPNLCAPCGSFTLSTTEVGAHTQPVCQTFSFTIPASITYTSNAANHVVTLSFTTAAGQDVQCQYRKNNGNYTLDSDSRTNKEVAACLAPNANLVAGSQVSTVSGVSLSNSAGPAQTVATVTLTATNHDQTWSGALLDAIDDTQATIATADTLAVYDTLPLLEAELGEFLTWIDPFTPADPEKTVLETNGLALLDAAYTLEADIAAWAAALQALYDQLDALLAYTQSVNVLSLLNQVGVQVNRTFGYPAAMKAGSTWVLMFQDYPNIRRATSSNPDGPFVVDANPIISRGVVSWAGTEVFEANPMCASGAMPYELYFGGRTVTSGVFTSGGISDGYSSDTVSWILNVASQYFGWTDVNQFRHFDVVRSSDGQHRMWYTSKVNNLVQVNLASTTAAWDDTLSTSRVCP